MPKQKKFKHRVRDRMKRTGETYAAAKRTLEKEASAAPPLINEPSDRDIYRENRRRFREQSLRAWKKLTDRFADGKARTQWDDEAKILRVLNEVGTVAPNNHTHMPYSGGLDLTSARPSVEAGCIEINFDGLVKIVRPAYLSLTIIENDPLGEWAFFWLETKPLAPSKVYDSHPLPFEEVLEVSPGDYRPRFYWDEGTLGEDEDGYSMPLPDHARVVTRSFRGSFLTVTKGGGYNVIAHYDGRHDRWGEDSYREQIQRLVDELQSRDTYGIDLRGR